MNVRGLVAAAIVVGLGFSGYGPLTVDAREAAANTVTAGSTAQAGSSVEATPSVQANIAAAQLQAQHLLSVGRAPAAASLLNSEAACRSVDGDLGTPAVSSIVMAERSWQMRGSVASVASWLYAHPPEGLQLTTWTGATADGGLTSCPADLGTAAIMAFAYRTGLDVDIWVSATGCPFLANGYIRTGWITVDVVNFIHEYT